MDGLYKLCRWVLGGIFIMAGSAKLLEPEIFAVLIDAYGIVPEPLLMPTAILLPILEITAGVGLLMDIRGSLGIITGLLILFIAVLGYGIQMGLDVDCGCFGPGDPEAKAFHGLRQSMYRDLAMAACAGFIYYARRFRNIRTRGIATVIHTIFINRR